LLLTRAYKTAFVGRAVSMGVNAAFGIPYA
jgi:hypothetical protein